MSGKADFSSAEWAHLKEMASLVGLGMIAASRSGLIGKLRELTVLSSCLTSRDMPGQFKRNELVMALLDDLAAEPGDLLTQSFRSGARDGLRGLVVAIAIARRNVLPGCEGAAVLLAARCPQAEAEGVKRWLLWIARSVAAASGDSWLGLGRKVSDEETGMLNRITHALHFRSVEVAPTPDELEAMLGLQPPNADSAAEVGEEYGPGRGSGE